MNCMYALSFVPFIYSSVTLPTFSYGHIHTSKYIRTQKHKTCIFMTIFSTATLQETGVQCFHDNRLAAASAHLLFLCVLPSQVPEVAADIRGHLTDGCIVYSLVAGVMLPRLQQLLEHTDIVKPHFTWPTDCSDRVWCHQCEITATFADLTMVEKTCPLSTSKDGEYVEVTLLCILIAVECQILVVDTPFHG